MLIMDITLPDDAIHITKYTTRFHEYMIDVWFSPSTQTIYSFGKYPRLLPIMMLMTIIKSPNVLNIAKKF